MDRKVVGVVLFGLVAVVAVVTSAQLLDVVWCSCSSSCGCGVVYVISVSSVVYRSDVYCSVV